MFVQHTAHTAASGAMETVFRNAAAAQMRRTESPLSRWAATAQAASKLLAWLLGQGPRA